MAGGNNKKFIQNPTKFLQAHTINVNPQQVGSQKIPEGLCSIDLVSVDPQMATVVRLEDYTKRKHGRGATPIKAYYLPAEYNKAKTLQLGDQAIFMFTADLSGCLFAAYGNDSSNLTVEHVNVRDDSATVSIQGRASEIVDANHTYCKILAPAAIEGGNGSASVTVYNANSCVVGKKDGSGWEFYYKPSLHDAKAM